jgi:Fe-S cluster assembly protein SufD
MSKIIVDYIKKTKTKTSLKLGKNEKLQYVLLGFEPGEKKVELKLIGKRAEAEIIGIVLQKKGQINIETTQNHLAPNTKSSLLVKSVIFDSAKLNYKGLIRVAKKARGTNAYQENKNLLMGKKISVETRPDLEILDNEVRCTHGSTISRLDKESLFYLMSRGLSKKMAEKIMVEGFLNQALEKISDRKIRAELFKIIKAKLK